MILWPDRIVKANNAKPTLRSYPDSIRKEVEGGFKMARRDNSDRPQKVERAIEIFLRSQMNIPLGSETLFEVSQTQVAKIINLMVLVTED